MYKTFRSAIVMPLAWIPVACLAGCMMGPDYQRPELYMPEAYRLSGEDGSRAGEQESLAARGWNEIYRDERLQELIRTALSGNLDLATARSRVREARSQVVVSRSFLFPELGLGSEAVREGKSGNTGGRKSTENTFTLEGLLSWEIDLWGANRRAAEAAEARWQATRENRQALEVSLIGEVATAYFELLDIDSRLKISELTVASREESVRIAKLRKEGGVISALEVQQAEVELAKAESNLPVLQRNRLVKENQLSLLLGRAPGDIGRGLDLSDQPLPPDVPTGLPSTLLERRPDIRQAEQELIAANALIGVAETEYFPKLFLTGSYGRESNELNDLLESKSRIWTLGLEAAMPVFNAGRITAQVEVARERCQQARISYRNVVLQALREVSDALESYHKSREELEVLLRLEASSREYVRLANLRYYNGILSYLDLLDAQRQLFDAELSTSEAKRNRLVALVRLYKALGGGWEMTDHLTAGSD